MSSRQIIYDTLKGVRERKIEHILKPATTIEPTFSISKTVRIMTESDSYDVFAMDDLNVVTTNARELLTARDIADMKISTLLHNIRHLNKTDNIEKAATMMAHYRIRSAPVVEDRQLVGVVHGKDIVRLLNEQNLRWIPASNILTPNPITITSNESLGAARKIMMSRRIDHLPVIKGAKVTQVLTSMHLLSLLKPEERIGSDLRGINILRRFESSIGNAGSTRVPNCATNTPLNTVMQSMLETDTTCCLLTLWDDLHGIITYKDLVNMLETKLPTEVPLYIVGLPEDMNNAELVTTKLEKIIRNLRKVYPEVEEAKAAIKTIHSPLSQRKHYEVAIRVFTPYKTHSYTELGWDLSQILDTLGQRIVRNLAKRSKRRWKTTIRKITKRDIF